MVLSLGEKCADDTDRWSLSFVIWDFGLMTDRTQHAVSLL